MEWSPFTTMLISANSVVLPLWTCWALLSRDWKAVLHVTIRNGVLIVALHCNTVMTDSVTTAQHDGTNWM